MFLEIFTCVARTPYSQCIHYKFYAPCSTNTLQPSSGEVAAFISANLFVTFLLIELTSIASQNNQLPHIARETTGRGQATKTSDRKIGRAVDLYIAI